MHVLRERKRNEQNGHSPSVFLQAESKDGRRNKEQRRGGASCAVGVLALGRWGAGGAEGHVGPLLGQSPPAEEGSHWTTGKLWLGR